MTKSANQSLVRETNQKAILEAIYKRGPLSRANLARMLSISKPASANNISRLLDLQVVREIGSKAYSTKSGRQPILVEFNNEFRYIFAIDISFRETIFAIYDLAGVVIDNLSVKIATQKSFEAHMINTIKTMLDKNNIPITKVFCIGISSPGIFDIESNVPNVHERVKSWFQKDIVAHLSQKLNIPVFIKNDANMGALGELLYGSGKGLTDLMYIFCGEGIGTGVILNSKLQEGARFNVGNISLYIDRQKLKSGKTVEEMICIAGVLETIRLEIGKGSHSCLSAIALNEISFDDVIMAYQNKDSLVTSIIRDVAEEISCIILGLASFLGLQVVIFGGDYLVFKDTIIPLVTKTFQTYGYSCDIRTAVLGEHAGLHGVFCIARNQLFDEVCSQTPLIAI